VLEVKTLLEKLSKPYWSSVHPSFYVLPSGAGLGKLAMQDCAAFNLVWATCKLNTREDHVYAVNRFTEISAGLRQEVSGYSLSDHIMLRTPQEFAVWYSSHKGQVNPVARKPIEDALDAVGKLQTL
jgi:hypothetical protein